MEFDRKAELRALPETPGVYLMYNEVDEIIYVGKAVNLKARVSQYFHRNENRQKRIEQMIANIARFEVIQVETELEALILESNLIKKYRPRYNAALRKDENHPYLRIDRSAFYPVVSVTTVNRRDEALYIGPFYKSMEMEKAVNVINACLGLRNCSKNLSGPLPEGHACLYFAMGQCLGPCRGETDPGLYRSRLDRAVQFFLSQDDTAIREELQQRMERAAGELDFEMAAHCKRMLSELHNVTRRLDFHSRDGEDNIDLFAIAAGSTVAVILLYIIRGGRLSGRDIFTIDLSQKEKLSESRILLSYVKQFYRSSPYIPGRVILTERIRKQQELAQELTDRKGKPVICSCPRSGEKGRFVQMTKENARELLKQYSER